MSTLFDAALQGMRETREQLRAVRKELEAKMFGNAEYHQEADTMRVLDVWHARYDAPPVSGLPGWKRHRWALRLRGR